MNNLITNRKVFAVFAVVVFVLSMLVVAAPVRASPGTLYVDADTTRACEGNTPCYTHPQDAVNFAYPGDTILVYPGTYGHRVFTTPRPPHWGAGDQYAPALIVFKDGLTIKAVDPDPSKTVIQTTYNFWVNKALPGGGGGGSIEHSTGCIWNPVTRVWDDNPATPGDCVRPTFGTPPNAVAIIASRVTIQGFTLRSTGIVWNTAGVMIGGLYAGDPGHLGSDGNAVENCVFSDVWHAVYIWHSSDNKIVHNTVATLNTGHWAAISTYDGYNDDQINLGHSSENNLIAYNTIANKGIALGAWTPPTWTSNAGSKVCCNTATQVGVTYAHGPVIIGCNAGGFWQASTDNVLRITGVTYTGDTELWAIGPVTVTLSAHVTYDGTADGSGIQVTFTVDGTEYHATTAAGGNAATTGSLSPGTYTVETRVDVCDNCKSTDTDTLLIKGTAKWYKLDAINELKALLPTGDKDVDHKLEEAIKHIQESVEPELWGVDDNHLNAKEGHKVFDKEKDAVHKLMELIDKKDTPENVKGVCKAVIDKLLTADNLLATIAYNDAKAGAGDTKVDKELAKCQDEFTKAAEELAKSKFYNVIEHYKHAWEHAQHALKHCGTCD